MRISACSILWIVAGVFSPFASVHGDVTVLGPLTTISNNGEVVAGTATVDDSNEGLPYVQIDAILRIKRNGSVVATDPRVYLFKGSTLFYATTPSQAASTFCTDIDVNVEGFFPPANYSVNPPEDCKSTTQGGQGGCSSPLLVDLEKNGFHLGHEGVGVWFDIDADGVQDLVQWVAAGSDDAFLFLDRDGNGIPDSGAELFGTSTPLELSPEEVAADGFQALAQYDQDALGGNEDGRITLADSIWHELRVWLDHDADGYGSPQEVYPLSQFNFTEIGIDPKENNRQDPAGNWMPLWDWVRFDGTPGKAKVVDVYFVRL